MYRETSCSVKFAQKSYGQINEGAKLDGEKISS
jgi:hypothetical protein